MTDADSDGWPEETDCDDNNPAIYPGAVAPECDTVDYDCDGTSNDCRLLGDFDLRDAKAILSGLAFGESGGRAIAGVGDVDGDGVSDFVAGAWQATNSMYEQGAAYVVRGGDSFPDDLDDAWAVIDGAVLYEGFGHNVRGGTDLSGDGRPDFLVDVAAREGGIISVFTELVAGRTTTEARSIAVGDDSGYFASLARSGPAAGDVTADGNADLVFWVYEDEVVSVDIVSGPVASDVGSGDWDARITYDLPDSYCNHLDGSGDLNADGIADIAVGCGGLDVDEDGNEEGGFVMLGPLSGSYVVSADADATFVGEALQASVGSNLVFAGDLNADGYSDLALSGERAGTTDGVYVLSGPISGRVDVAKADAYITGDEEFFLSCLASAGDIDRDGRSDLLFGAVDEVLTSGLAWLQYGPVSGRLTLAEADTIWSGDIRNFVGAGCAGPGDITGDGGDDLLVTSMHIWAGTTGQVFVLEGVGL